MKKMRLYVDTSVVGGCLDEEFSEHSRRLLQAARDQRVTLLISSVVLDELAGAPAEVVSQLQDVPPAAIENTPVNKEVIGLRNAYLQAGILGPRWEDDATHVAAATVAGADAIVSWNFKHIVRLDKIKAYNQINLLNGYGVLTIVTPKEVVFDELEEDDKEL